MYYHSYQVSKAPDATGTDLTNNALDWIKQNDGFLLFAGIGGLVFPYNIWSFQKGKSWETFQRISSLLVLALGGYGFLTSGKLSFGTLG